MSKLLTHEELLDLTSRFMPIISPRYFPIHPSVYDLASAYTQEFAERIRAGLEESVVRDIATIRRTLGKKITYEHKDLDIRADPVGRTIDVGYAGSNIALHPESHIERIITTEDDLPPAMRGARALVFSREPDRLVVPSWYTHTPEENGINVYLYLRNFAILFNNLGITSIKSA